MVTKNIPCQKMKIEQDNKDCKSFLKFEINVFVILSFMCERLFVII
jgi:hypothetical protein